MIRLDVSNQSQDEVFELIVKVSESSLKIKPFFTIEELERGSALLENITFVSELYYSLDRGMNKSPGEGCFTRNEASESEDISLTKKLFERSDFESRFHELCSADTDLLNNNSQIQESKKELAEKLDEMSREARYQFAISATADGFKSLKVDSSDACSDNTSGNPFGNDSDEDSEEDLKDYPKEDPKEDTPNIDNIQETINGQDEEEKSIESESQNPFGDCETSEEEEEEDEEDDPGTNPFKKKAPARPPPPKTVSPKKKEMAPLPPPNVAPFNPSRPKRPPPPKPKGKAPGYGNPVVKRDVSGNIEEIRSQLLDVEQDIQNLESQCQKLEDIIRLTDSQDNEVLDDEQDLFKEWILIIKNRNALSDKHKLLGFQLRFNLLDERHAELEYQMRKVLNQPVDDQTDDHAEIEEALMAQIVDIVNKKDELSQTIENFSKADLSEPELQLQAFIGPDKQMARVKKSGTIRRLKKILIKKPKEKPEKSKKSAKK